MSSDDGDSEGGGDDDSDDESGDDDGTVYYFGLLIVTQALRGGIFKSSTWLKNPNSLLVEAHLDHQDRRHFCCVTL